MLLRKDPDEMTDGELQASLSAIENIMQQRIALRDNPRYKKKFRNQPPPIVNPALVELKSKLELEIFKRRKENINV